VAFVILRGAHAALASTAEGSEDVARMLREQVAAEIGPIAKPRTILVVPELPKTRSGRIMRRLLRDVAEKRKVGDATTLADPSIIEAIRDGLGKLPTTD
jgi:acetyl-CoA synthetase